MEQMTSDGQIWSGAALDNKLIFEALGAGVEEPHSGATAFAYLWRRFGPPAHGSDEHKNLCCYYLTTNRSDVALSVYPKALPLFYSIGYLLSCALRRELERPEREWGDARFQWWLSLHPEMRTKEKQAISEAYWADMLLPETAERVAEAIGEFPREQDFDSRWVPWCGMPKLAMRINRCLYAAMRELLRPVYVRDVPITIFGRITDEEAEQQSDAPRSKYAGYGVPLAAMDKLIADND